MELDWRLLRTFVAVAESKTMDKAAMQLGLSQPTVSRHIKQLEDELNMMLFERAGSKLLLTDKGISLFEEAKSVRDAVLKFERQAKHESEVGAGGVRIMMHCMIAYHFAPSWLSQFQFEQPQIAVDLTVNDQVKLLFREVEIAVQITKPTQADLIVQRVGQLRLGLYASKAYLDDHPIHSLHELPSHSLIGFERNTDFIDHAKRLKVNLHKDSFVIRTEQWAMHPFFVQSGLGIGIIPIPIAEELRLSRVCPEFTLDFCELYMTAHPELRRSPHIRLVWDHLVDALKSKFGP